MFSSRLPAAAVLTIFFIVSTASHAFADAISATPISNGSPVVIRTCEAFPEKIIHTWNGKTVQVGHLSPLDVDDRNRIESAMHLGISFFNGSITPASAVRVIFHGYNSFHEPVANAEETFTGTFSTNALIERTKTGFAEIESAAWQGNIAKIDCIVNAISFNDGSVWKEQGPTVGSLPPMTSSIDASDSFPPPFVRDGASMFSKTLVQKLADGNQSRLMAHEPVIALYSMNNFGNPKERFEKGRALFNASNIYGVLLFAVSGSNHISMYISKPLLTSCKSDTQQALYFTMKGYFLRSLFDQGLSEGTKILNACLYEKSSS